MSKDKNQKNIEDNSKNIKKADVKATQAKNTSKQEKEEVKGIKKLFSEKNLAIVVTAISLVAILAIGGIVMLIRYFVRDEGFDYSKSDLSKYIEFTSDYKNFTIDLDYAPMNDIDLAVAKLNLQAEKKGDAKHGGASVVSGYTITPGAEIKLWYRGYLKDSDGKEVEVSGMSNFTQTEPMIVVNNQWVPLEIGSSALIPGFELGLVGKNVDDYAKFEKITTGKVKEHQIAYVTFTTKQDGKDVEQKGVRIDMASDVDEKYGAGFRAALLEMSIGEKKDKITVKKGDNNFDYTKVTVNFVTECEKNSEKRPIIVEAYFPYDYSKQNLRNEKAYFEVYVESAVLYEYDEFDDAFVQKLLDDEDSTITAENLQKYEGTTLTEKYETYAKEVIENAYDEAYNELLEDAIWSYYRSITKMNKYPKAKVETIYKEYLTDVEYQFSYTGGVLSDSYGQNKTYSDLESFACAYLGLPANYNWREYLTAMAQSMVQERMLLYYIMELEGLNLSEDEFNAKYEETVKSYLDEYVKQHLAQVEDKTREDFTDAEYEQYVLERRYELFQQYDETFFTERTYYTTLFEIVKEWPTVTTLEDKSAYFDKYK